MPTKSQHSATYTSLLAKVIHENQQALADSLHKTNTLLQRANDSIRKTGLPGIKKELAIKSIILTKTIITQIQQFSVKAILHVEHILKQLTQLSNFSAKERYTILSTAHEYLMIFRIHIARLDAQQRYLIKLRLYCVQTSDRPMALPAFPNFTIDIDTISDADNCESWVQYTALWKTYQARYAQFKQITAQLDSDTTASLQPLIDTQAKYVRENLFAYQAASYQLEQDAGITYRLQHQIQFNLYLLECNIKHLQKFCLKLQGLVDRIQALSQLEAASQAPAAAAKPPATSHQSGDGKKGKNRKRSKKKNKQKKKKSKRKTIKSQQPQGAAAATTKKDDHAQTPAAPGEGDHAQIAAGVRDDTTDDQQQAGDGSGAASGPSDVAASGSSGQPTPAQDSSKSLDNFKGPILLPQQPPPKTLSDEEMLTHLQRRVVLHDKFPDIMSLGTRIKAILARNKLEREMGEYTPEAKIAKAKSRHRLQAKAGGSNGGGAGRAKPSPTHPFATLQDSDLAKPAF